MVHQAIWDLEMQFLFWVSMYLAEDSTSMEERKNGYRGNKKKSLFLTDTSTYKWEMD